MTHGFEHLVYELEVQGVQLKLAAIARAGKRAPVVFLHGFGSTKEDYADIVTRRTSQSLYLLLDSPSTN